MPNQSSSDALAALAAEKFSGENVINSFTIDARAPNKTIARVDYKVLFESGSSTISPTFEPILDRASALMAAWPTVTITVVGHTDDRGDEVDNLRLSLERATTVVVWLVERGIHPDLFSAEGLGEVAPIAPDDTASGREKQKGSADAGESAQRKPIMPIRSAPRPRASAPGTGRCSSPRSWLRAQAGPRRQRRHRRHHLLAQDR